MNLRGAARRVLAKLSGPPRHWRPQWLPRRVRLQTEAAVHPHSPEERADQFLAADHTTAEMEVLNWLHATACLTKPEAIVETGSYHGFGTLALAAACRANGFGRVHVVELDESCCKTTRRRLQASGLAEFVDIHCDDSRRFLRTTPYEFQMGFFDSLPEIRAEEFRICRERGILEGVAAFHDTSPLRTRTLDRWPDETAHRKFREDLLALSREAGTTGFFELRLSRGLFVVFLGPR